jgi:predicted nucleic acid-binding protein
VTRLLPYWTQSVSRTFLYSCSSDAEQSHPVRFTVSDSGPLITWDRVGGLPLLKKVHPDIVVAKAVATELQHPRHLYRPGHDLLERGLIREYDLYIPEDLPLPPRLGRGDKASIRLARQVNSVLLIDDRDARKAARASGIATTATLATLKLCKKLGLISAVRPLLEEMLASGFRLAEHVRHDFLRELGEL